MIGTINNDLERALQFYESAGLFDTAAEVAKRLGNFEKANQLYDLIIRHYIKVGRPDVAQELEERKRNPKSTFKLLDDYLQEATIETILAAKNGIICNLMDSLKMYESLAPEDRQGWAAEFKHWYDLAKGWSGTVADKYLKRFNEAKERH